MPCAARSPTVLSISITGNGNITTALQLQINLLNDEFRRTGKRNFAVAAASPRAVAAASSPAVARAAEPGPPTPGPAPALGDPGPAGATAGAAAPTSPQEAPGAAAPVGPDLVAPGSASNTTCTCSEVTGSPAGVASTNSVLSPQASAFTDLSCQASGPIDKSPSAVQDEAVLHEVRVALRFRRWQR